MTSPVPDRMRLLHIGPHKTGTTTVQAAFHQNRDRLEELGVHYAGNRAHAMTAAMGAASTKRVASNSADAGRLAWEALQEDVRSSEARAVVLSSEFFCEANDDRAGAIVDALDASLVHVVLTLRPLVNIMSSQWQQYIQNRLEMSYDEWLSGILSTPPSSITPSFWRRHRHDDLVRRWADIVGPERVTVIVLDERDHGMLLRSFEDLLRVPRGTLVAPIVQANRSLTLAEVELLRVFNGRYAAERWSAADYTELIRFGAARRLQLRSPEPTEPRLATPQWAIDRAVAIGAEMAQSIAESGVNVVGSLASLESPSRLPLAGDNANVETTPDAVAASFLAGVVVHLASVSGMPLGPRRTQGPIEAAARERHRRRRINTHLERTGHEIEQLRKRSSALSAPRRMARFMASRIRRAKPGQID